MRPVDVGAGGAVSVPAPWEVLGACRHGGGVRYFHPGSALSDPPSNRATVGLSATHKGR